MDVIFAVTLSLFSIGMNSPEGKQIKEGLQMFRGYIFQLDVYKRQVKLLHKPQLQENL